MKAKAFAPGHVSGLFAVHDEAADPLAKGSRGAGWSVAAGATAVAEPAARTRVTVNGAAAPAATTRRALDLLEGGAFAVDLRLELPVGQGFGMSAAGSLAACLAAAHLAGLDPEHALAATHRAEVESGTGLGDAVGAWFGAGEVRTKPGCPPAGWALRIEPAPEIAFVYCVVGEPIATRSVIRTPEWKARTRALADPAVDRILAVGRGAAWEAVLDESAAFTQQLGLLTPAMAAAGAQLGPGLRWGQCMLGTTLWAAGPPKEILAARRALAPVGAVIESPIDLHGARIVR